jgi:hypothetical protein
MTKARKEEKKAETAPEVGRDHGRHCSHFPPGARQIIQVLLQTFPIKSPVSLRKAPSVT